MQGQHCPEQARGARTGGGHGQVAAHGDLHARVLDRLVARGRQRAKLRVRLRVRVCKVRGRVEEAAAVLRQLAVVGARGDVEHARRLLQPRDEGQEQVALQPVLVQRVRRPAPRGFVL